jgi:hypothetical protein
LLQSLLFDSSSVCWAKRVVLGNDGCDFEGGTVSSSTLTETSGDQSSSNPRRKDTRKVELDRLIGPFLDLFPSVDQVLHTSGIQVGDSGEVHDDSSE